MFDFHCFPSMHVLVSIGRQYENRDLPATIASSQVLSRVALRSDERNNNTTSSRNKWIVVNERSNSSKESKSAWDEESVTPYPESHFLHMHEQERFVAVYSLDGQIYLFTPLYPDREWKIIEMPTDTTCGVPKGTRGCVAHSCCQTKRLFIGMDVDLY